MAQHNEEGIKLASFDFIATVNMHKSIPAADFEEAKEILRSRIELGDWHKFVADPFMLRAIIGNGWQIVLCDNQPCEFGCAESDHDEFSIT